MKKGEIALVTIHPEYAFGPAESAQELAIVPANSTVYYEVEMVSFVKVGEVALVLTISYVSRFQGNQSSGESKITLIITLIKYRRKNLGT